MTGLRVPAFGKINISLDIMGLRDDGYHELSSVMQSIKLADWLTIKADDSGKIKLAGNSSTLSLGDDNLIIKAAKLLQETFCPGKGAEIYLEKNLPIGAGLGGGSSDGAATMKALNHLWGLNLTTSTLVALAAQLGADLPFTLVGGTVWARGKGEMLTILPPAPKLSLVLAKPSVSLSAGEVYRYWDQNFGTSTYSTPQVLAALEKGEQKQLVASMGNDLERAVLGLMPRVQKIIDRMHAFGVERTLVSGSGPVVVGVVRDEQQGISLRDHLLGSYGEVFLTCTI
ncbi:MAG: 4-(cytidine 5'-diphospho)-2-C-methyl-D-erythritol kinase [Bacillota bacterium]